MKKIGFIDYYLSEWHANNYPKWFRENIARKNRDFELAYAWAELDEGPRDGVTTGQWCERFGFEQCRTIAELVEKSDCLLILSPDNPEKHEAYATEVLPAGKPVFIDKTFAPDCAAAKRIAAAAARNQCPMFSSSALRFGEETEPYRADGFRPASVIMTGPGEYGIYSVHLWEAINSVMKRGAKRVRALYNGVNRVLQADYGQGRTAFFAQSTGSKADFSLTVELDGEAVTCGFGSMFPRQIDAILDFFETKKPPVAVEDTLEIMALIDAASAALETPDAWVEVKV